MDRLRFISTDEILEIHNKVIESFGGRGGLRDPSLLSSAAAMPKATFGGQRVHATAHAMAAAYMFHTIQNHPFIDGNKRTGAVTAVAFLELNGYRVEIDNDKMFSSAMAVAEGQFSKSDLARLFKCGSTPETTAEG